jgi:hypothetical protein
MVISNTVINTRRYDGFKSSLNFAKQAVNTGIPFQEDIPQKSYDNNDLGINFYTNFYNLYSNLSYRIVNPTKKFNTFKFSK